ncbi:universal stress protein [Pseudomaricurvus alkylphenolicus]|jgi:hypothetical protein|uniref:universal stress protein n=1 Tax=Pseudomaricurvus alkylphenolicus TaxID=1306991 RepID=UPI00141F4C77|nr:universal stress protein [Pseudomaricurvus alkylphenolicus]NIB41497.1 universal stress protein [Pseudomaricurvus alkylphenolicus]
MNTVTTIVDTSHTDQHTLDRAFDLALHQGATLHLHGLSCGYSEKSGGNGKELLMMDSQLSDIKHRAQELGITTTTSQSHGHLWESAFLAILKNQENPVVVTSYPDRHLWQQWLPSAVINKFIFQFPCDVLMVKEREHWQQHRALMLMGPELSDNGKHKDDNVMDVIQRTAACGKQLESFGLEVFYLCVYPESQKMEGADKLQDSDAVRATHMMFRWGEPEKVVPELIDEWDIDLLAVDIIKAKALGKREGAYIHRLGQKINCDIMAAH